MSIVGVAIVLLWDERQWMLMNRKTTVNRRSGRISSVQADENIKIYIHVSKQPSTRATAQRLEKSHYSKDRILCFGF